VFIGGSMIHIACASTLYRANILQNLKSLIKNI